MALKDTRHGRDILRILADDDPERLARLREAMAAETGHTVTETGDLKPYDTCGQPVDQDPSGRLVTIVGRNAECYGSRRTGP
jgi:hypothetical protein